MAARRSLVKTVLGGLVDGLLSVILCFITMENDVIYNLTVSGSVIIRYVKDIRKLPLFFLRFVRILVLYQI